MDENSTKHLELIQGVVNRMSDNSFKVKGFSIAILTAIIALYGQTKNTWLLTVCFVPVILFWILDSYYLQQERKFRKLYETRVVEKNEGVSPNFDLNIDDIKELNTTLLSAMFYSINFLIYLALLAAIFLINRYGDSIL